MLQQIPVEMVGQHAQIDLQASGKPDAGLGWAFGKYRLGARPGREVRDDVGRVPGRADHVDVSDRHLSAPQATGKTESIERGPLPDVLDCLMRDCQRQRKRRSSPAALICKNAATPILDRLASQTRDTGKRTGFDRAFQVGERRNSVLCEEHRGGFGPDAAHA